MRNEIRSLTGLRGIAALLVVAYHYLKTAPMDGPGEFIQNGYLWVDLFFILSGFVMAETYGKLFMSGFTRSSYGVFLGRRIARVYPLYIVMTIVCYGLAKAGLGHEVGNAEHALVANIFAAQTWVHQASLDRASWSISTEWAAYLLFPILVVCALKSKPWMACGLAVGCYMMLSALVLLHTRHHAPGSNTGMLDMADSKTYAPVIRCLTEFTLGLLTWRACRSIRLMSVMQTDLACWSITVVLVALMSIRDSDLLLVPVFSSLIMSLSGDRPLVARLLGSRLIHLMGIWSYAIYLIHDALTPASTILAATLAAARVPAPAIISAFLLGLLVILLAGMSYNFIELPGRRYLRWLFSPRRTNVTGTVIVS